MSNSSEKKIRFRHIHVTEVVKGCFSNKITKQDHVLTLATHLDGDKLFVGYALNRVSKNDMLGDKLSHDRFDPNYGRTRAVGRLNSRNPLVIPVQPGKPMIDNIVQGLLALPTEGSGDHYSLALKLGKDISEVPAVPSALKNLLRKSVREYKAQPRFEG